VARLSDVGLKVGDVDLGSIDAESDYKLEEYFVTTPYVQTALTGRRRLFLGYKGSGKSALFSQLPRLLHADGYEVVSITPDQYAWAALKEYRELGIQPEQAHTNAWKLTLAVEVAARLASMDRSWTGESEAAVQSLRAFLTENYGTVQPGLRETATSILKGLRQFNLSAFGFGVGWEHVPPEQALTPTVAAALFEALTDAVAEQGVVVALDRLDDSWDGSDEARSLLVGLLKATKELNDRHGKAKPGQGLRVLAFLRTDIYDTLRFDDKDKHRPTEEHIRWRPDELKDMLQRRLPSQVTVDELFEPGDMRGSIAPFNYIVKRTFLRPREVLQFVNECIRVAGRKAVEVTKDNVRTAEERYSRWKVDDLKQEFSKVFPDYSELLECLRQELHRYDSIDQMRALIEAKAPDLVKKHGMRVLLEILLESSVMGVRIGDAGSARFKSEDSDLVLPIAGAVYVHQSVYRGLKIRETRKHAEEPTSEPEGSSRQDRITIELYGMMMSALPIQDLTFLNTKPTPPDVFRNETFDQCAASLAVDFVIDVSGATTKTLARPNVISPGRLVSDQLQYRRLRAEMLQVLITNSIGVAEYEAGERAARRG
jgi:hypothetical protein